MRILYFEEPPATQDDRPLEGSIEGVGSATRIVLGKRTTLVSDIRHAELVDAPGMRSLVELRADDGSRVYAYVPRCFQLGGRTITINNEDATRKFAERLDEHLATRD